MLFTSTMKKHGSNSRQQTHHDSAPITHPDTKKILGPDRSNGLHHEPAGAQEAEARHFAAVRKHKQRQCAASRGQNTPACKRWQGKAQQSTPHTPNCERTDAPLRIRSCILGVEIQIWGVKHSTLLMLAVFYNVKRCCEYRYRMLQCFIIFYVKHCEYRYVAVCQCFTCKTPRIVEPLLLRPTLRRKMQNSSSPLYWKKASFARLLDVPKFQMHRRWHRAAASSISFTNCRYVFTHSILDIHHARPGSEPFFGVAYFPSEGDLRLLRSQDGHRHSHPVL